MSLFEIYVRTPLVFVHFLCAAYALVTMITLDVRTIRFLRRPLTQSYMDHAKTSQIVGGLFLGLLYVTGFAFVIIGAKADGGFLNNENLYFKMTVVLILTLNLFATHLFLRDLDTGDIIDSRPWVYGLGLRVVPVVSIASWLWAAFSGVARSWNYTMPIEHMLGLYVTTISVAVGIVILFNGQWGPHGKKTETAVVIEEGSAGSIPANGS